MSNSLKQEISSVRSIAFRSLAQVLVVGLWMFSLGALFGLIHLEDLIAISLYQYFGSAAVLGWLFGNVYAYRLRRQPGKRARSAIWGYLLTPPGLIYLLHAANDSELQSQVPLAPIFALMVFVSIFSVPAILGRTGSR